MVHIVPAYRQLLKRQKPVKHFVPRWTEAGIQRLQGCFASTDCGLFIERIADLHECARVNIQPRLCDQLLMDDGVSNALSRGSHILPCECMIWCKAQKGSHLKKEYQGKILPMWNFEGRLSDWCCTTEKMMKWILLRFCHLNKGLYNNFCIIPTDVIWSKINDL